MSECNNCVTAKTCSKKYIFPYSWPPGPVRLISFMKEVKVWYLFCLYIDGPSYNRGGLTRILHTPHIHVIITSLTELIIRCSAWYVAWWKQLWWRIHCWKTWVFCARYVSMVRHNTAHCFKLCYSSEFNLTTIFIYNYTQIVTRICSNNLMKVHLKCCCHEELSLSHRCK